MTTVAQSITKVRRLIRDESSKVVTSDNPILNLIARVQQEFAKDTLCLAKVQELQAPPEVAFSITHLWEEGYVSSTKVMIPFLNDGTYASCHAFELAGSYNIAGDGYTVTCGDDVVSVDPQHPVPLFPAKDYYRPMALFWDYKAIEQKSFGSVDEFYDDGWHYRGTEVDFFSHVRGLRRKALVTRAIPYEKFSGVAIRSSLVGEALRADVFVLCYKSAPERVTATTDTLELNEPFQKYVEFRVASRLLKSYYQIRDVERAAHLEFRYKTGVQLVSSIISKQNSEGSRRLGGKSMRRGRKPPYPRLPQHYPSLRTR